MSIRENIENIKWFLDDISSEWILAFVVMFIGISSFGLGRLSALSENEHTVYIRERGKVDISPIPFGGLVVASRSGSKYHFPWCSGAKRIAQKNRIWFKSEEEAKKHGYTPAGNCKGLK